MWGFRQCTWYRKVRLLFWQRYRSSVVLTLFSISALFTKHDNIASAQDRMKQQRQQPKSVVHNLEKYERVSCCGSKRKIGEVVNGKITDRTLPVSSVWFPLPQISPSKYIHVRIKVTSSSGGP